MEGRDGFHHHCPCRGSLEYRHRRDLRSPHTNQEDCRCPSQDLCKIMSITGQPSSSSSSSTSSSASHRRQDRGGRFDSPSCQRSHRCRCLRRGNPAFHHGQSQSRLHSTSLLLPHNRRCRRLQPSLIQRHLATSPTVTVVVEEVGDLIVVNVSYTLSRVSKSIPWAMTWVRKPVNSTRGAQGLECQEKNQNKAQSKGEMGKGAGKEEHNG